MGNWIEGAIKKPGALTAMAKAMGGQKKEGGIKHEFLEKAAKAKGKLGQRARLAQTLKGMPKKGC